MKKYTWCFAGQIHAQGGRAKMIESLKKCNGEYHLQVNKGWQSKDSLGAQDYRGILSDSFFVPCPRGNTSIDTFRLYEALEVGSIPIVEKSDYWENLLGEHPLIETDCWDGIHKDINLLLENKQWVEEHSKKIQKWWSDYKISLKTKIKNIISDQKEDIEINKKYDICFCCDSNLIQYAINPINAIIQKNKEKNITIHFIYSGEESELTFIEQFLENKPNFTFKKYIQSELNIKFDKSWRSISHLSNATNLKLQIPEILQGIDKVIYFDIDTIPYVDLKEFDSVKTDVSGIAMRQEIKNGWRTFNGSKGTITENKNPIPFGNRIIGNSGVMVLDLVELRQNNFTEFCLNEKRKNNYNIPLTGGDQDLINIFCQCNFNILPDELNILVSDQLNNINDNTFEFKRYDCFEKNGVHCLAKKNVYKSSQGVLHFIGKDKPWNSYGLTSDFWRKFSLINENINLHERAPVEIVDYFDIDCQLTKNNLCNIVKQIQDKKFNCNMLVFGLGKDSVIYDTVNKGYTLFIETNQAWIDLNEKIKNKILYTFPTTVQDSLPINKDYLSKFDMPDFIKKTKWDIILIDAPPGDRLAAPGRALPIYWSSQIAKKYCTTVFIDDCCRDLEKEYCDEFFSEIHFNMNRDIERDEFRAYKQKQNNAPIDPHLKTKKQQFIKIKDKWEKLVNKDTFLEWAEDSNFKASFSCYNPGRKIGIVSLYTPEIESYAIYSELNIREYCEKQGYTFYVYRDSLDKSSHGNWSKAKALLNHIDDHEEIIWMDSDIVIYNPEKKFEDILSRCVPIKKVIACEDIGSNNKNLKKGSIFNSGVVIFRKHEYTKNILKRWWNFRLDHDTSDLYSEGGDQEVLIDILKKSDPFGHNHKVFPMNTFNTEPRFVDDDTFILHFMAYPRHLKDFFIKHFYFNEVGVMKNKVKNITPECGKNIQCIPKTFVIGFNKTATTTIDGLFRKNHLRSQHNTTWDLESYDCFSDTGSLPFFKFFKKSIVHGNSDLRFQQELYGPNNLKNLKKLCSLYPDSRFVLNLRPLNNWLISRYKHGHSQSQDWAWPPSLGLTKKWIEERYTYYKDVLELFSTVPNEIILVDIEEEGWMEFLATSLGLSALHSDSLNIRKSSPGYEGANAIINDSYNRLGITLNDQQSPLPMSLFNEASQYNNNFSYRHFTLVQIGAHNGSKIKDCIIKACEDKKNVLLIEPVPYLFNQLKKSFGGYKNIFLDNCAISDSNESKDLFYVETKNLHDKPPWTSELNSFNKSHILNHNFHAESKKEWSEVQESEIKSISLECKTFLDLCLKHGISSIDLLQVDTEGHDFNILKTLNPKGVLPKKIIFERKHMDGTFKEGEKYKDLVLFLNRLGYSVGILDKENSCAELISNKQKSISPESSPSTEEIDICFCCDHNIVHYIPVVLNSILHKNPSTPINVHLLYNGDKHNISVVENYFKDKPFLDFYFYDSKIPKSNLQSDPDNPHFLGHVTNASHLKYLIPETLSHLNRVIYLDIDLIAPINLKFLHSLSTGPKGIAMRNEIHNGWLNINGKQAGNSGVMVMNLEKLRSLNFTESCLEIPNPVNHEQNVINLFCEGLHGRLDDRFNIYAGTEVAEVHSIDSLDLYPLKTQETKDGPRNCIDVDPKNRINVSNGYILHYTASKPWNPKSKNSALWNFFKNYKIKNF